MIEREFIRGGIMPCQTHTRKRGFFYSIAFGLRGAVAAMPEAVAALNFGEAVDEIAAQRPERLDRAC